jgi:myosin V
LKDVTSKYENSTNIFLFCSNKYTFQCNDLFLNVLSDILKVNKNELRKWLVNKQIESGHEILLIPITKSCAEAARDALAKHIYAKLFQYIVEKINKNLFSSKKQHNFIG